MNQNFDERQVLTRQKGFMYGYFLVLGLIFLLQLSTVFFRRKLLFSLGYIPYSNVSFGFIYDRLFHFKRCLLSVE